MPSNWDVLPNWCRFWDNTSSKGRAGKDSLYLRRLPFSCHGQHIAPWEVCAWRLTDSWLPGSPAVPVVPQPFPLSPPAVLDERTEEKNACKFRQQSGEKKTHKTINTYMNQVSQVFSSEKNKKESNYGSHYWTFVEVFYLSLRLHILRKHSTDPPPPSTHPTALPLPISFAVSHLPSPPPQPDS